MYHHASHSPLRQPTSFLWWKLLERCHDLAHAQAILLWWLWSLETLLAVCFSGNRSQGRLLIESPTLWRAKEAESFLILLQRLFPLQNISSFTLKSRCLSLFNSPRGKKTTNNIKKTTQEAWNSLSEETELKWAPVSPVNHARRRGKGFCYFFYFFYEQDRSTKLYFMYFNIQNSE